MNALLAAASVAALTAVLSLAREQISPPTIVLLYLLPVTLSTAAWGLGVGVLASVCAFLAFNFFFIPPYYSLQVHHLQDLLNLLVLLGIAIFVSQIVGRARAGLAVAQAREHEALQLFELSQTFARLSTREQIAQTLAERLHQAFNAAAVSVVIWADSQHAECRYQLPSPEAVPATPPQFVAPLLTTRGELGEVNVWRVTPQPTDAEKRLLFTFAGQGALALEHAVLEETETHTRVLAESDRLKSSLLSSVSHELRTPLASIQAAVSSLRSDEVQWTSPARAELLAMVEEEAEHLNRLVGNLLDMSRIEAGALKPQRQWNLLADIVEGTLHRLRRATETHRIVVDVPDDLPLAPVDHVLLDQVFTNLIGNSLKYAPAGSTITLSARAPDEHNLLVRLTNEGPPVPAQHLQHIFDKFYRVVAADRVTGTGLGLSICKGIVEAHGGRIWAENVPGGLAIAFTLPLDWAGHFPPRLPVEAEP